MPRISMYRKVLETMLFTSTYLQQEASHRIRWEASSVGRLSSEMPVAYSLPVDGMIQGINSFNYMERLKIRTYVR